MQRLGTWCPIFPGFYETHYGMDTEGVCYNFSEDADHDVGYDDIEWDYAGYAQEVSKEFVNVISPLIIEILPAIRRIEFEELRSPQFYNFSNDAINIQVIATKDLYKQIQDYLKEYEVDWHHYLQNNYTDRSGFWSSYLNDAESWEADTANYTEYPKGHRLGSIFQFICEVEGINDNDLELYHKVMEGVYPDEFAEYKGIECVLCGEQHTKNIFRVCGDCVDDPGYQAFMQSVRDHQALMHTPTLPGIELTPVELTFTPTS